MILREILVEDFHENGKLSYRATRAVLSNKHAHLYPERRRHPEGYYWIYVGVCGKWDKNGKQQWVINYNAKGEIIK